MVDAACAEDLLKPDRRSLPSRRKTASTRWHRRTAALAAEFDRFLEEVFEAVSAAMTDRRWQDVSPALEAYAAGHVGLTAAKLFHRALAHRLARHALTLTDREQFDDCLPVIRTELERASSPPPLTDTIRGYQAALAQRDALDAFATLPPARSREKVH
jgi:hypothetical protein